MMAMVSRAGPVLYENFQIFKFDWLELRYEHVDIYLNILGLFIYL